VDAFSGTALSGELTLEVVERGGLYAELPVHDRSPLSAQDTLCADQLGGETALRWCVRWQYAQPRLVTELAWCVDDGLASSHTEESTQTESTGEEGAKSTQTGSTGEESAQTESTAAVAWKSIAVAALPSECATVNTAGATAESRAMTAPTERVTAEARHTRAPPTETPTHTAETTPSPTAESGASVSGLVRLRRWDALERCFVDAGSSCAVHDHRQGTVWDVRRALQSSQSVASTAWMLCVLATRAQLSAWRATGCCLQVVSHEHPQLTPRTRLRLCVAGNLRLALLADLPDAASTASRTHPGADELLFARLTSVTLHAEIGGADHLPELAPAPLASVCTSRVCVHLALTRLCAVRRDCQLSVPVCSGVRASLRLSHSHPPARACTALSVRLRGEGTPASAVALAVHAPLCQALATSVGSLLCHLRERSAGAPPHLPSYRPLLLVNTLPCALLVRQTGVSPALCHSLRVGAHARHWFRWCWLQPGGKRSLEFAADQCADEAHTPPRADSTGHWSAALPVPERGCAVAVAVALQAGAVRVCAALQTHSRFADRQLLRLSGCVRVRNCTQRTLLVRTAGEHGVTHELAPDSDECSFPSLGAAGALLFAVRTEGEVHAPTQAHSLTHGHWSALQYAADLCEERLPQRCLLLCSAASARKLYLWCTVRAGHLPGEVCVHLRAPLCCRNAHTSPLSVSLRGEHSLSAEAEAQQQASTHPSHSERSSVVYTLSPDCHREVFEVDPLAARPPRLSAALAPVLHSPAHCGVRFAALSLDGRAYLQPNALSAASCTDPLPALGERVRDETPLRAAVRFHAHATEAAFTVCFSRGVQLYNATTHLLHVCVRDRVGCVRAGHTPVLVAPPSAWTTLPGEATLERVSFAQPQLREQAWSQAVLCEAAGAQPHNVPRSALHRVGRLCLLSHPVAAPSPYREHSARLVVRAQYQLLNRSALPLLVLPSHRNGGARPIPHTPACAPISVAPVGHDAAVALHCGGGLSATQLQVQLALGSSPPLQALSPASVPWALCEEVPMCATVSGHRVATVLCGQHGGEVLASGTVAGDYTRESARTADEHTQQGGVVPTDSAVVGAHAMERARTADVLAVTLSVTVVEVLPQCFTMVVCDDPHPDVLLCNHTGHALAFEVGWCYRSANGTAVPLLVSAHSSRAFRWPDQNASPSLCWREGSGAAAPFPLPLSSEAPFAVPVPRCASHRHHSLFVGTRQRGRTRVWSFWPSTPMPLVRRRSLVVDASLSLQCYSGTGTVVLPLRAQFEVHARCIRFSATQTRRVLQKCATHLFECTLRVGELRLTERSSTAERDTSSHTKVLILQVPNTRSSCLQLSGSLSVQRSRWFSLEDLQVASPSWIVDMSM
jgi:hypothetical protein